MKSFLACTFALALSLPARPEGPLLVPTVQQHLDRAGESLAAGNRAEAQAYAESAAMGRAVSVSFDEPYADVVQRALSEWEVGLGVTFVQVPPSDADLRISFKQGVTNYGRRVMGLATICRKVTKWSPDTFTSRTSGCIEISTQTPDGLPVSRDVLASTTMHEIGHFFGLEDTMVRGRLMGPIDLVRPVLAPTPSEIDCLLRVRIEASQVLDQLAAKFPASQSGR